MYHPGACVSTGQRGRHRLPAVRGSEVRQPREQLHQGEDGPQQTPNTALNQPEYSSPKVMTLIPETAMETLLHCLLLHLQPRQLVSGPLLTLA